MNYINQCQKQICQEQNNISTQMIAPNNNSNPFCPEEAFMLGNYFSSLYLPYCGMTNFPLCPANPRQALLTQIMMWEFNMHELNLYLDTHPNDQQALDRFHEFHEKAHQARNEYEKQFGPLAIFDIHTKDVPWPWIQCPWPWQRQ